MASDTQQKESTIDYMFYVTRHYASRTPNVQCTMVTETCYSGCSNHVLPTLSNLHHWFCHIYSARDAMQKVLVICLTSHCVINVQ